MQLGKIAGYVLIAAIGFGIGYLSRVAVAPGVPGPVQPSPPYAIPSPGAMYAEQHFPNIHKYGGPAPFYTGNAQTNGSLIFID